VNRHIFSGGQHNRLSASAARDIGRFLDRIPGEEAPTGISALERYETMLDTSKTLELRSAQLTTLEEINYQPIFDVWEDTSPLSNFRDAGTKLDEIERMIPFLTSHIAFMGKERLTDGELSSFNILISSFRSSAYRYARYAAQSEAETGRAEIKELIDTIEYLHETARELQVGVVGKLR